MVCRLVRSCLVVEVGGVHLPPPVRLTTASCFCSDSAFCSHKDRLTLPGSLGDLAKILDLGMSAPTAALFSTWSCHFLSQDESRRRRLPDLAVSRPVRWSRSDAIETVSSVSLIGLRTSITTCVRDFLRHETDSRKSSCGERSRGRRAAEKASRGLSSSSFPT